MTAKLPKLAFSRLSAAPPPESVQFFDGYFPQLAAQAYKITVTHKLQNTPSPVAPYQLTQQFTVQAPEFTIDPAVVQSVYPANGAADIYDQQLPFIVIADPSLPWERGLDPLKGPSTTSNPLPWMTLVLFAEGEVYLQSGGNPVVTTTVGSLLT